MSRDKQTNTNQSKTAPQSETVAANTDMTSFSRRRRMRRSVTMTARRAAWF